jgi:NAD(P)-dependent dehydrogenase (short-subunit alcohol dehydrogenase family)
MPDTYSNLPVILITGGTSGLGLELVMLFLKKGFYVIATGRKQIDLPGYEERFRLYKVDFSDLDLTAETIKMICNNHSVSYVINNAGILSPPGFMSTRDGNEYTFQVNFLSHLLINELIIQRFGEKQPLCIAAITSMVYKMYGTDMNYCRQEGDYSALKAYSDSKLFLAMMCSNLAARYTNIAIKCFSFDPGVFSSTIYRMRGRIFRILYKIAAPFMRKPSKVATVLAEILTGPDIPNGAIFNIRKGRKTIKGVSAESVNTFWEECYSMIKEYFK